MNRIFITIFRGKSSFSLIINALIWASLMIVTSLLVDDAKTTEFLVMMFIAGWFLTSPKERKITTKK